MSDIDIDSDDFDKIVDAINELNENLQTGAEVNFIDKVAFDLFKMKYGSQPHVDPNESVVKRLAKEAFRDAQIFLDVREEMQEDEEDDDE